MWSRERMSTECHHVHRQMSQNCQEHGQLRQWIKDEVVSFAHRTHKVKGCAVKQSILTCSNDKDCTQLMCSLVWYTSHLHFSSPTARVVVARSLTSTWLEEGVVPSGTPAWKSDNISSAVKPSPFAEIGHDDLNNIAWVRLLRSSENKLFKNCWLDVKSSLHHLSLEFS